MRDNDQVKLLWNSYHKPNPFQSHPERIAFPWSIGVLSHLVFVYDRYLIFSLDTRKPYEMRSINAEESHNADPFDARV